MEEVQEFCLDEDFDEDFRVVSCCYLEENSLNSESLWDDDLYGFVSRRNQDLFEILR